MAHLLVSHVLAGSWDVLPLSNWRLADFAGFAAEAF